MGYQALSLNTSGNYNSAIGWSSLYTNSSGNNNTASGFGSLYSNNTGSKNAAHGQNALFSNTIGNNNSGLGSNALYSNSTGSNSTAVGEESLYGNTTGVENTAVGYRALLVNDVGNRNTALGSGAFTSGTNYTNSTAIGFNAQVTASNMVRIGDASVTSINGAVDFTVVSDKRFKKDITDAVPGLSFIMKLRPVTYHFDMDEMARFMKTPESMRSLESEKQKGKILQTGFLAQEVEQAAAALGYDFSGVDKPDNEGDYYGLRYSEFTVPLVKAVQEQQLLIEKLTAEVNMLRKQLDESASGPEGQKSASKLDQRLKRIEEMLSAKAHK